MTDRASGTLTELERIVAGNVAAGMRLDFETWGLALARAISMRADCTRRQVGAVIFDEHSRIVATGYNGAPSGMPGCLTAGACPRGRLSASEVAPGSSYDAGAGTCIALHAEQNALLYSDAYARRGGTMFVTDQPCAGCLRQLNGSGLARVCFVNEARAIEAWELPTCNLPLGQAC